MVQVFLPLKNPDLAKSRLAVALSDDQRAALVQAMALDTVDVVLASRESVQLTVIAPAHWQALLPRNPFLNLLREEGLSEEGLNGVLREAVVVEKPDRALVLHGDLPFLDARDLCAAVQNLEINDLVLCPDAAGEGTNALGFHAPAAPAFRFGPDSFAAHRRIADAGNQRWVALERPGFARDVDTPADVSALLCRVASGEKVGARTAQWAKCYGPAVLNSLESATPIRFRSGPRHQAGSPIGEQPPRRSTSDPEHEGLPL